MEDRILRWESPQRYYAARLHKDLLGDLVLDRAWGGRHNNVGHTDTVVVLTPEAAEAELADIAARRTSHNYRLVFDTEH